MRFVATMLLWLVTTVLLAAAVPAAWAQQHLVDEGGFAALAQKAAGTTQLQDAMANEIGAQLKAVVAGSGYDLPTGQLVGAASIYTGSSSFPASSPRRTGWRTAGCSPTRCRAPTHPAGGSSTCPRCWPTRHSATPSRHSASSRRRPWRSC